MRYYSKRELYALGETLGDSVTEHKVGGGRIYGGGGKGGGGGTQQSTGTTYTTNIPDYAEGYVHNMLGATQKQLFDMDETGITGFKPYQPYSTNANDYVAGFQPLQETAMRSVGQMQAPGQFGTATDLASIGGIGSLGAGQQYAAGITNPAMMQSYMSPYQQNVTDVAKSAAIREAQMAQNAQNLGAARQGTYGGARQTLAQSERERNLLSNLSNIQAQGSQAAFDKATQAQQFGANLGMQGYGQAIQGAGQLGQLGGQQFGIQKDIVGLQSQLGKEQQALEQQKISQSIQDWANTQQYPLMQLGVMSNMLRGLPMQSATSNQYVAAPNALTQGIGLAGAGASIFNAMKKEGGVIKEMASGGITSYRGGGDVEGAIENQLYDMQPDDLTRYIKETSSPSVKRMAQRILKEKSMAGGGIVAFSAGDRVKEDPEMVRQAYIDAAREQAGNQPTFDTSVPPRAESRTPLTEKIGRALGIKDAGRQVPTRETTAMPLQASGSDVPMVARSPELAAAEKALVNPKSIVAAAPAPAPVVARAEPKAEPTAEPTAAPKAAPAPATAGTGIKATPSSKIMPTAGIKLPNSSSFGIEEPVDPDTNKTIAQIAADKAAYMGTNVGAQEARAKLMSERTNSVDEARRVSALRMAEFFGAWGSTPGNTIVAGLNALKNKVPDIIGDMKEETKIRRQIDKDIAEIEKIERLEKAGNYEEASKRKSELAKNAVTTYGTKVKAASDAQQTAAYREVGLNRGPGGSGAGGGGEDRALNNLIGKRTDIEKAITTKQKEMSSIVRIANRPDSKDPEVQAKIVDARAKVRAATSSLQDQLNQVNGLINTYKKVQGLETQAPGTGAPGSAGNPIVLK